MRDLEPLINDILPQIIDLRHRIHEYPELGFQEHKTAERVLAMLGGIEGLEILQTQVAETGIVALLFGGRPGPCVALRAEMDCLPIQEETGKPYASKRSGLMHACGHDGHTACAVGAAMVLSKLSDEVPGPVKLIFQPAEEGGGGAAKMCEAGVLRNPDVAAIFGLHGWPWLELGRTAVAGGPIMAGSHAFEITVTGRGGHAARPQAAIDPLVAACQIVTSLQTVVSRTISPKERCVLTVSSLHCGQAHNVIADKAVMRGTLRAYSGKVLELAVRRMKEIIRHTALAFGVEARCEIFSSYPPLVNDSRLADFAADSASAVLGENFADQGAFPVMYSEDFAFYCEQVPGCFWALGVCEPGREDSPKLHQSTYDFPDAAIAPAIRMHCELVRRYARGAM